MDSLEIKKEIEMAYEDLCDYLVRKYGPAVFNYFLDETCCSKSTGVTRTNEGLYCHHRREDMGVRLSDSGYAIDQPFEWQTKENLVYCNLIEHLILHIKIAVLRKKTMLRKSTEVADFFTTGGIFMICEDVIELFKLDGTPVPWKRRCYREIRNNYSDFIEIVNAMFLYIESHYEGEKKHDRLLVPGKRVEFSDTSGEIIGISKNSKKVHVKLENGKEFLYRTEVFFRQLTCQDCIDINKKRICTSNDIYYEDIYRDMINAGKNKSEEYSKYFEVDFIGYGFPQFTRNYLDFEEFGSHNVDQYLSKGLPSNYGSPEDEVISEVPTFWKGTIPSAIVNNDKYNYVIRVNTAFHIKRGKTPFLRYNGIFCYDPRKIDNDNNMAFKKAYVPENTSYYDYKTKQYYAKVINKDGVIQPASLVFTIAKEDIPKFYKIYNVEMFEILDGCYWEK